MRSPSGLAFVVAGALALRATPVLAQPSGANLLFCEKGVAKACTLSGMKLYDFRPGGFRDPARAVQFLQRGCDGGDPEGCTGLAALLQMGEGIARDDARAKALLERACKQGYERACRLQVYQRSRLASEAALEQARADERSGMAREDSMQALAGRLGDVARQSGKDGHDEMAFTAAATQRFLLAAQRPLREFAKAGAGIALTPARLRDRTAIRRQRVAVEQFRRSNAKLAEFAASFPQHMATESARARVSAQLAEAVREAVAAYEKGEGTRINAEMRRLDETYSELLLRCLDLLESELPAWRADRTGKVVFRDATHHGRLERIETDMETNRAEYQRLETRRRSLR